MSKKFAPVTGPALQLNYQFDGGAASYIGIGLFSWVLTIVTIGFAAPWAICMRWRWRCEHTLINGCRVRFTGSGGALIGQWIKWLLLCIVTLGVYSLWVAPRLQRWIVTHQAVSVPIPQQPTT